MLGTENQKLLLRGNMPLYPDEDDNVVSSFYVMAYWLD